MKKVTRGIIAIGALIGTPVLAADLPVKAPVYKAAVAPVWSWTGFYVGGDVGAKGMDDQWTATSLFDSGGPVPGALALPIDASSPRNYNITGARAGGYVGYNWQFDPKWVAGVEADMAWAYARSTQGGFPGCSSPAGCVSGATVVPNGLPFGGDTTRVTMNWDASIRGRLGYLIASDTLIYGTGGVAFQNVQAFGQCVSPFLSSLLCFTLTGAATPSPGITQSATLVGPTIGAGVEQHLWGNWLLRAEYRYANFGSWSTLFAFPSPAPGVGNNTYRFSNAINTNIAEAGLAYKF
jgi:outer membrane immunogenic protein